MPLLNNTKQIEDFAVTTPFSKVGGAAIPGHRHETRKSGSSDAPPQRPNPFNSNSIWPAATRGWRGIESLTNRYHRHKVKWVLQAVAMTLALVLVIWPQLTYSRPTQGQLQGVDPQVDTMRQAKLRGIDRSGRPFIIAASEVQKLDHDGQRLSLLDIRSELRLANNGQMELLASNGDVDQKTSQLNLNNQVAITRHDGFRMDLSELRYNWLSGEGVSQQPVSGKGPHHQLQADGLKIELHGNRLTFLGHAILHL